MLAVGTKGDTWHVLPPHAELLCPVKWSEKAFGIILCSYFDEESSSDKAADISASTLCACYCLQAFCQN